MVDIDSSRNDAASRFSKMQIGAKKGIEGLVWVELETEWASVSPFNPIGIF